MSDFIKIEGARTHNLKNISLEIPHEKLVVITGLSGSGKSSLAFDTIFAEGQRRYLETYNAYARQFVGQLTKPDVDHISGLSPVIAIEQKTVSKNPRSTVGTITEIYDFLRLLFARVATPISSATGLPMVSYTEKEIFNLVLEEYNNQIITITAPLVKSRKGHYRELFDQLIKQGFTKVYIDGEIINLTVGFRLDRYKTHDISLVVDSIRIKENNKPRLKQSLSLALKKGKGEIQLFNPKNESRNLSKLLMCSKSGISLPIAEPNLFSFNSPKGACPQCNGLGYTHELEIDKIIPNKKKSIKNGGIEPLGSIENNWTFKQIDLLLKHHNFELNTPIEKITEECLNEILYGTSKLIKILGDNGVHQVLNGYEGIGNFILRHHKEGGNKIKRWASGFMDKKKCNQCNGARLKDHHQWYQIDKKHIGDVVQMDINNLEKWVHTLNQKLNNQQNTIAKDLIKELSNRIGFLMNVGLEYLHLNLPAATLSGGEAQRIRLASQIGSELTGVLYILDEPSIGLHQRDNHRLIESLKKLRDKGNTVIVVEHDKDIMNHADMIIDIGPGAGKLGGEIIAKGNPKKLNPKTSLTAQYLLKKSTQINNTFETKKLNHLELLNATGNNLKNVHALFPLNCFICVTGVSGSGKSTLINETLFPILNQYFYKAVKQPLPYRKIKGLEHVDKVIGINQSPIGRTPRSNPATYTGIFNFIRDLFAQLPEAKIRGYKPGRFSFNVKGGRCETCVGAGMKLIEMNFLPDVYVKCDGCNGKRYNRETLEVKFKGKSINDVLNMTIDEAIVFFKDISYIYERIKVLKDVGLGYVHLGQSSTTLSGGEAQRIKLASELGKKQTGNTFYIMDEPTTGLHHEDINLLLKVIKKLIKLGNSVLVIEHNMDVILASDYIIDLGPEGGAKGGEIIFQGGLSDLIKNKKSHTGKFLALEYKN